MSVARRAVFAALLIGLPFLLSPFQIDLACQVFIACIGSLALMLLTGFAGQISLGHSGLLAAGAFTAGILATEVQAPFVVTVPAAILVGALLGLVFGLPSLRLRGVYLAVSTIALDFVVTYLGGEYEAHRGLSAGLVIDPPSIGGFVIQTPRQWYFTLLIAVALVWLLSRNILSKRTGRAWGAIMAREAVAQALGINLARYKLLAFVLSSAITAFAGALLGYYRSFVSVEAFSLDVTIQYVAMVIIGGLGSLTGALLGAAAVTLLPYGIETVMRQLPGASQYVSIIFAINYAAFGLIMIGFLLFEPHGLMGAWHRLRNRWRRKRGVERP